MMIDVNLAFFCSFRIFYLSGLLLRCIGRRQLSGDIAKLELLCIGKGVILVAFVCLTLSGIGILNYKVLV